MMQPITSPTLLLNKKVCKANLHRMVEKTSAHDLVLKPHMKTHQSETIGEWIKEAGIKAVTVSSIEMARYFYKAGWKDITIAFPANPSQSHDLNELAADCNITVLINSSSVAKSLANKLTQPINAYIEIDTGADRTGIPSDRTSKINDLIAVIQHTQMLQWIGFYSHPGHSYQARSEEDISKVHQSVLSQFQALREKFSSLSDEFEICVGDTPSCSVADSFTGIDAISPGNFVFYDLMQTQIGSCEISDIAVVMACPVVDRYPQRNEIVIHGGAIHFSKEQITQNGVVHFGQLLTPSNDHWELLDPPAYLTSLSQEHGIISCNPTDINNYTIGDTVYIAPVHSCLTANIMERYKLTEGQTIDLMK
ncbi:alanine racemase [Fodinibius halophilus]|uniref:Alanine racemase n=1 Tax=Fodinibius halophilus TaxID=1736908 RepID=A0A6M1T1U8_9BACT|nr:alanine racemase [Fodinibius halophilus]NGP87987.1 alanine racemase [Fodinibius halophilus]